MLNQMTLGLMLCAMLSGCAGELNHVNSDGAAAVGGEKEMFSTVDGLLRAQAREIASRMGWTDNQSEILPDYDVEVYYGGPSIGSLISGEYGNLINSSACPAPKLADTDMNAFSSYTLTSSVALELGIPVPSVPIGITAKNDVTTSYSLEDAKITLVDADQLAAMIATPACKARASQEKGNVWIVRGIIAAKRTYNFSRQGSGGVTLTIAGSSNGITGSQGIAGAQTDSGNRTYFMILSPVSHAIAPPAAVGVVPASPGGVPDTEKSVADECSINFGDKIFIQRDITDDKNTGINIREALSEKFNVEKSIEAETIMPNHTEVRYYYDSELPAANCALATLKAHGYNQAILNRRNRAAPQNMLEIWLAKNKT